ncbi:hypothetical protein [Metapseudomonas otitidis]|uniref:hypothetical protein n=1 Tax=Metapseudomonas otitidis TaxID=319939 RepID=UPI002447C0BB|nr:hypothetical protein [Pseudomonas otitidis]MDH1109841.1 hypothetical protein [Pseudomonas otitidis]MDH1167734.1 hypothetical protein [Pseudomonas otitidis]
MPCATAKPPEPSSTGWLERLQQVFQRAGFDLPKARQRTRLLLAATRVFHLDLLTTGDRDVGGGHCALRWDRVPEATD